MNSKSIGSDIVYAWKNAKIGVMEAAPAVKIMYADEIAKADNAAALINEKQHSIMRCRQVHLRQQREDMWTISSRLPRQDSV